MFILAITILVRISAVQLLSLDKMGLKHLELLTFSTCICMDWFLLCCRLGVDHGLALVSPGLHSWCVWEPGGEALLVAGITLMSSAKRATQIEIDRWWSRRVPCTNYSKWSTTVLDDKNGHPWWTAPPSPPSYPPLVCQIPLSWWLKTNTRWQRSCTSLLPATLCDESFSSLLIWSRCYIFIYCAKGYFLWSLLLFISLLFIALGQKVTVLVVYITN